MNEIDVQIADALRAAEEREAALRDVLRVLRETQDDLAPVFDVILENAARLCDAPLAFVTMANDERTELQLKGHKGDSFPGFVEFLTETPMPLDAEQTETARSVLECKTIHIEDLRSGRHFETGQPHRMSAIEQGQVRTLLIVPLVAGGKGVGAFNLWRAEVNPFTPDQIALVETFAAQAVIAIETVRQFRELQTRLEREEATREILEVISRSRSNEAPVFDVILESAARLCDAPQAFLLLVDEDQTRLDLAAYSGTRSSFVDVLQKSPLPLDGDVAESARAVLEQTVIHTPDLREGRLYEEREPHRVGAVELEGVRTRLLVPLISGDHAIGALNLYRREVRPFTDGEIALVETFAAQAVIAIENVRQFRELQTRLEREQATGEILGVISRSRDDDLPVFNTILENAARLCDAPLANLNIVDSDRTHLELVTEYGDPLASIRPGHRWDLTGDLAIARAIREAEIVHAEDLADDDLYRNGDPVRRQVVDEEGVRTFLAVPLISNDQAIGSIGLIRREVRPFTDDQITLVRTFAAQAVIAIENVRQFRELQTRLEREAASREILGVISRSRDDEIPVFDTILANAARLCGAQIALMCLVDDERTTLRVAALLGQFQSFTTGMTYPLDTNRGACIAVREARIIHRRSLQEIDVPDGRAELEAEGINSLLWVPLMRGEDAIGVVGLFRTVEQAFLDDEIALVETFAAQAVIAIENVRQFRELQTRLEREAASREILGVISRSRDDEGPVFEVILSQASRLCDAPLGALILGTTEDTHLRLGAEIGAGPAAHEMFRNDPPPMDPKASFNAQVVVNGKTLHLPDMAATELYKAGRRHVVINVDEIGIRSYLAVPLLSDGRAIGVIGLYRKVVQPFTDDQIALVETFAAQAVIAIENVRQFRELQETNLDLTSALERQTATSEVLDVISQSPSDAQPVFDVIAATAQRLCICDRVIIWRIEPDGFVLAATLPDTPEQRHMLTANPASMDERSLAGRAFAARRTLHVDNLQADPVLSQLPITRMSGNRTMAAVPLFSPTDEPAGLIMLARGEVQPFNAEEIALVETFANQAAIAIENVRLFTELQNRLEREAASREILQVISRSRDDEKPVFDVILENALKLCNAPLGGLFLYDKDDPFMRMAAQKGARSAWIEMFERDPTPADPKRSILAQAVVEKAVVQIEDMRDTELYRDADRHRVVAVEDEGMRTVMAVPMLKGEECVGVVLLYRREIRLFSEAEVALVETFAAQAVIAIENVRQFRELQTRLEREKASREILGVISGSRDDEIPVFDTILANAARLCEAPMASLNLLDDDGSRLVLRSHWGTALDHFEAGVTEWALDGASAPAETVRTADVVHIEDFRETRAYKEGDPVRVNAVEKEGIRTFLCVPLLRDGSAIGTIALFRRQVEPFNPDQISLVETFAAQAVIAIENVRQFRELQTRLEREQATGEVLGVISGSRDDEGPVFDVILENVTRLCDAPMAMLAITNPERTHMLHMAGHGCRPEFMELMRSTPQPLDPEQSEVVAPSILEKRVVQVEDLREGALYRQGQEHRVHSVDVEGMRSVAAVPLVSGDEGIGAIVLYRHEARLFDENQLQLARTFAAQAVIAIENVRQFRELQTRLEREAATREILQVISRSRDDEKPVFDMILKNAVRLCGAPLASLNLLDDAGERLILQARWGDALKDIDAGATEFPLAGGSAPATAVRECRLVHIEDMADTEAYTSGDPIRMRAVDVHGIRTFLAVPLLRDGKAIGCIDLFRREASPFEGRHIDLIETFAAQAVIAIENVRQFRELQTRLQREAATREILEVISLHPDNEQPVFEAIMNSAARLCDSPHAALMLRNAEDTHLLVVASNEANSGYAKMLRENPHSMSDETSLSVEAVTSMQVRQYEDIEALKDYTQPSEQLKITWDLERMRTLLYVPLIRGDRAIGTLALYRLEVKEFTSDDIELLKIFAAQAVIAIENVRQFRELQTRLEREKATGEVLSIISQSRDDEQPVFDAILESSARLCDSPTASLFLLDKERDALVYRSQWGEPFTAYEVGVSIFPMSLDIKPVQAVRDGRTYHVADIAEADTYLNSDPMAVRSVEEEGIRTLLSVPLMLGPDGIGCINLVRREVKPFDDRQIELVKTFAAQAVIAIENVRQFKALEARTEEVQALNSGLEARVEEQVGEIERMGKLKSFLPAAVADAVVSSGSDKMLQSHRALLGILFCDIRGFTAFCETAEPEETIEVLQTYHQEMGRLIAQHGAGVDHRMGDGIMVLFNDPLPCDDPAGEAVRLAMAMREKMAELCGDWKKLGHRLGFGVGVSLGYATVGMVGYEGRSEYTASGTAVNLAARLCDRAEDGEILLSPRAAIAVEDEMVCEPGGELELKGIAAPVEVVKVVAMR